MDKLKAILESKLKENDDLKTKYTDLEMKF